MLPKTRPPKGPEYWRLVQLYVGDHQVVDPGHTQEAEVADGEEGKQQAAAEEHLII